MTNKIKLHQNDSNKEYVGMSNKLFNVIKTILDNWEQTPGEDTGDD